MEKTIIQKESNILDPVQDTLDQDVFNGTVPKKEFFDYHLDHIREVFRQNGFNPYAFDFYLTGSLCTYQYSDKSDVDISIICNVNEFSEEDRSDLISIVIESLDGEFFPRTRHQYQHFVQPVGVDIEDLFILGMRSAWDFQKNKWVVKPRRANAHNIQKEKPDWILAGVQVSDKINTLIDYHQYDKAISMYKDIHRKRKEDQIEYGDYSEGNIIYKFLDNNGTFDRLRNIGQKISMNKQSMLEDLAESYSKDFIESRIVNSPTHLNRKGKPCNCSFGRSDKGAVRKYYKSLNKINKNSSVDVDESEDENNKVKDIFQKVIEKEFNPESRWSKRFPVEREKLLKLFNDEPSDSNESTTLKINHKNIKYLTGAIQLLKDNIRRENIVDNEDFLKDFILNNNSLLFSNIRQKTESNEEMLNIVDKIPYEFREVYRIFATNNFGKGFEERQTKQFLFKKYLSVTVYIDYMFDYLLPNPDYQNSPSVYTAIETYDFFGKDSHEARNTIESIKNERPEETINKIFRNLDNVVVYNFNNLASTLNLISSKDIQRITKEYNISFPSNIKELETWNLINVNIYRIIEEVQERENYKKLVNQLLNGEIKYDQQEPVYTVEFKKNNPEKARPGKWGVYPVETIEDMALEGELMDHCIGSDQYNPYNRRLHEMNKVYSVRDPNGVPRASIEMSPDGRYVAEARGPHNQHLTPAVKRVLNEFFGQESFQRESMDSDRYIIRTANGEEKEYKADNLDKALEEHKEWVNSWLVPKEEKNNYKAVAGYGAGHHWFDLEESDRTADNWGFELDAPPGREEEVELPYWEREDIDQLESIGEAYEWLNQTNKYNSYLDIENLVNGYTMDPELDELDNIIYIYIIEGMDQLDDIFHAQDIINDINDKVDEFWDADIGIDFSTEDGRETYINSFDIDNVINNYGVCFGLLKAANTFELNYINFYLDKKITEIKNNTSLFATMALPFYMLIKQSLSDIKSTNATDLDDLLSTINEFDEYAKEDFLKIKYDSYAYYSAFGGSSYSSLDLKSYNRNVENIDPKDFKEDYSIDKDNAGKNIEKIKDLLDFGNNVKLQILELTKYDNIEENPYIFESETYRYNWERYYVQKWIINNIKLFFQAANNYIDDPHLKGQTMPMARMDTNNSVINRPFGNSQDLNTRVLITSNLITEVSNFLEYKAHQLYNESLKPMTNQMSFFDMPPEPTKEEYAVWQERADFGLPTENMRDKSLSWAPEIGFING